MARLNPPPRDGVLNDVTGRRTATPVGGRDTLPGIASLEGSLTTLAATMAEANRLKREEQIRIERDVRSGRLPSPVGTHGSTERRDLVQVIEDTAHGFIATLERKMAEAIPRLEARARPEGWTPPPPPAPQPSAGQPQSGESGRTSPVSDPATNTPTTDQMAPARSDARLVENRRIAAAQNAARKAEREQTEASVAKVRQSMQSRIGEAVAQYGDAVQDRVPTLVHNPATGRQHVLQADGSMGEIASDVEEKAFARATRSAGILRNYGSSIQEAGSIRKGIGAALPGPAVRALGVAGVAYGAANKVLDFAERQRIANDQFREIQGGSQADAFQERAAGRSFRIGQRLTRGFGGMSATDADALFMGTTQAGLQGNERQNALDFGAENFRKYAMNIQDSLRLIEVATQNGQHGLAGVAEALDGVTEAAVRSGVNAKQARDAFVASYSALAPSYTGQGTAAALAGGTSANVARLGHEFAGINTGASLSDPMLMRRIAAQTGQDYADVVLGKEGQSGQERAIDLLEQRRTLLDQDLSGQLGPEAERMIRQAGEEARRRGEPLSYDQTTALARRVKEVTPNLSPDTMASILQNAGITGANPNNAIQFAIQSLTGGADDAREAREQFEGMSVRTEDPSKFRGQHLAGASVVTTRSKDTKALVDRIGGDGGPQFANDWGKLLGTSETSDARSRYMGQVAKDGKINPMVERLLKMGDDKQKFTVKAGDGKGKGGTYNRVVSLDEGLRYFRDQFDRGDVKIAEGEGEGGTIADLTGGHVDADVEVSSDDGNSKSAQNQAGRSERNFNKDREKGGGREGKVIITPSPALERLLRFSGEGIADTSALTPPDPHPAQR